MAQSGGKISIRLFKSAISKRAGGMMIPPAGFLLAGDPAVQRLPLQRKLRDSNLADGHFAVSVGEGKAQIAGIKMLRLELHSTGNDTVQIEDRPLRRAID